MGKGKCEKDKLVVGIIEEGEIYLPSAATQSNDPHAFFVFRLYCLLTLINSDKKARVPSM